MSRWRRGKAGIPQDVTFQTKPRIALDRIGQAAAGDGPKGVVPADAGHGNDTAFRGGLTELGRTYVAGARGSTAVWAPGTAPLLAKSWSGAGRRPKPPRRNDTVKPVKLSELARSLPAKAWRTVHWREGTKGALASRFAALRTRPSHRDYWRAEPWPREWLPIAWPEGEKEPAKYWLSTMPATTKIATLAGTAKLRSEPPPSRGQAVYRERQALTHGGSNAISRI